MANKISINDLNGREAKLARSGWPPSKWMLFCRACLDKGWRVSLHEARETHSKYIYVRRGSICKKVRFSDHKPNIQREEKQDCDIWVGAKNMAGKWITWEDAIAELEEIFKKGKEKKHENTDNK